MADQANPMLCGTCEEEGAPRTKFIPRRNISALTGSWASKVQKGYQRVGVLSAHVVAAKTKMDADAQIAEAFMLSAAASATAGIHLEHGGPFGAAIVRNGVVISCAHNTVLEDSDPTCHAEMNAIRDACRAAGSHDLSDCELYTTCEPCPMCWGGIQWSRMGKIYIGVDRFTAAKYGFDDKVFYDEVDNKAGYYRLKARAQATEQDVKDEDKMLEVYDGLLKDEVEELFKSKYVNTTLRRRLNSGGGLLAKEYEKVFALGEKDDEPPRTPPVHNKDWETSVQHVNCMRRAIWAAKQGAKHGKSKEREPFGAVIVKNGEVIAEAHNTVLQDRDATATAEVNVIREAARRLNTHNLSDCAIYCTAHPDLMSLGAILWARVPRAYCGVSQQLAAQCGFEEGLLHFKELVEMENIDRTCQVVENVAKEQCEQVFKEWSDLNGQIY
eukprot:gnl/MRDRNA2_/MRDRNA2_79410_c0_seq1.p1 gnl/MRDRNA2_/MRDRNA2_79410_c0~~gnl/MRDRNA2_/MRDRNA2_79410_c0_seq1.p1  ORF type:complete len:441 (-),score=100.64 gnl/MRDRNA2_/MRDRNA2_79410_c0_seq1:216-1538(-)